MTRTGLAVAAALLLTAGCAAPTLDSAEVADPQAAEQTAPAPAGEDGSAKSAVGSTGTPAGAADRAVIRTATIALVADEPLTAADTIADLATYSGGYVESIGSGGGCVPAAEPFDAAQEWAGTPGAEHDICPYQPPGDAESVVVTIRIPAESYDKVLDRVRGAGEVRSVSVAADDVTASTVDLQARIRAQRASVDRLVELMKRANDISDVIAVEQELASRQATLESLQAQRRRLADAVSLATITVTIVSPQRADDLLPPQPHWWDEPWSAFWDTWALMLLVAAALAPMLIVLAVAGAVVVWLVRRRRGKSPRADATRPAEDARAEDEPTGDQPTDDQPTDGAKAVGATESASGN